MTRRQLPAGDGHDEQPLCEALLSMRTMMRTCRVALEVGEGDERLLAATAEVIVEAVPHWARSLRAHGWRVQTGVFIPLRSLDLMAMWTIQHHDLVVLDAWKN